MSAPGGAAAQRQLVLRPAAGRELLAAHDWYEAQRPGLGREFVDAVDAAFATILGNPTLYRVVRGRTRRALVDRFPYGVFYYERGAEVVVVTVVHGRRHPRRWQRRAR